MSNSSKSSLHKAEAPTDDPETMAPKPHQRAWYTRVPFTSSRPPPPPNSTAKAEIIPEVHANWLSYLTFEWMRPLLSLGYARPLEASDLYKLQDERASRIIAEKILNSYERRVTEADEYNARLASGEVKPGWKKVWWLLRGDAENRERQWREKDGRRKASLTWAMNDAVKWWFWSGGIIKVIGDTAQITSPLVVKALINFAGESYISRRVGEQPPPIGKGVGLAICLFLLQIINSLATHHFFYRSTTSGVLIRGGLITAIYTRSLRLSSRARGTLTNGKLVNHISTDVSRIDFCAGFFHMSWTAPIQLIICLILLLLNLGPSALVGYAFFVLITPAQSYVIKKFFILRHRSMAWTDKRAKILQELLGGMKIIKYFAWEHPFLKRISEFRQKEMNYIRTLLVLRSANNAIAISIPALASVLSFVTYALLGHSLNPADIFASLTLFNLLRLPLMFLPLSFSAIADAANAIDRLYGVFEGELLQDTPPRDTTLENAIEVTDASFSWDAPPQDAAPKAAKSKSKKETKVPVNEKQPDGADPDAFKLHNINLKIPRGQLVAIVGPVGTGKSSLLQGMIGEMRRTSGSVKFGGSVAYCPQMAWIQNATVRENICFGQPFDEERYWKAVKDACLEADLDLLPNGDQTQVGEKGISLSGGQKQRLNICRAIYSNTDIQLFDDPLSALDAHVGQAVFTNVLQNNLAGKTRVLVTHALHFLPYVDYIYTIFDGRIVEQGTYTDLMNAKGSFSRFILEFGSQEKTQEKDEKEEGAIEANVNEEEEKRKAEERKKAKAGTSLMQDEERNTGAVAWEIYKEYIKAGNGSWVVPLVLLSLALAQVSQVMSSYWLVYWQEDTWHESSGFYMGIYAALGASQAVTFFMLGASFALLTYFASKRLHQFALTRVLHAPMSFFETTPLGRIMNRFSKDIDTIDNLLGDSLRMLWTTASSILGAIILIAILIPWFLLPVFVVMVIYIYVAIFYQASAREIKRLDSILRSSLYTHFSESLSGLSTIRAYGEVERFRQDNEERVDIENRAYWLTFSNQRWLGIRLDGLGSLLTFMVAILTVATRFSISPSQTGVALSYILSVSQSFGWLVRQSAETENNMNSVERVVYYAHEIEQEPPYELPDKKPPAPWPSQGKVELKNVVFKYRPNLPPVLKDLTMTVAGGEKIGIVGRTGAGKSSIMTALFRLVELTSGSILIDGVDISTLGLADVRSSLSIIPQDPLLFSGTLRSNLDPFGQHDDARLWDALKRSYLVEQTKRDSMATPSEDGSSTPVNRLSLDSPVEDEGSNLSVGERSLVSLARALVKDTKVLILDEATASVDYETDRKIQDTIASEFADRTILCIAHRLRTIISYDRICVLDAGRIAEFDTPTNLFQQEGSIFRTMCDRSSITLEDIQYASKARRDD